MSRSGFLLAALMAAAAIAGSGCFAPADDGVPEFVADPLVAGWRLDCSRAAFERSRGPWAQDCETRASHTVGPKQEIWLAINPTDPNNVVIGAKDNNPESSQACVWNGVFVTHDGGATWSDVTIGGRYIDRQPGELWYGFACNTDPMFRFAADGTLHYAVEMYNLLGTNSHGPGGPSPASGRPYIEPVWRLLLATSHDGGDTWPDVVDLVDGDGTVALNDYSRMTVNPMTGTILTGIGFLSGTDFTIPALGLPEPAGSTLTTAATHSYCWMTASRDKGKTAALPIPILQNLPAGIACQVIAASPTGTVVLGGQPGASAVGIGDQSSTIYFARSTDDGVTFTDFAPAFAYDPLPVRFNNTAYRTGSNFELAYDSTHGARRGTLYVLYGDDSTGDADVYLRSSFDDGASWSQAVRVNQDHTGAQQFNSNLAVAGDGSIHVFFMDRAYDPRDILIGITHSISVDGGLTWQSERVSTKMFDGELGVHQEGFPFIGDYIGVDAVGKTVWAGFPDASNGATTIVAAARVLQTP